jgi:hypothetical protein
MSLLPEILQSFSFDWPPHLGFQRLCSPPLPPLLASAVREKDSRRRSRVFADAGRWVRHGEVGSLAGGRCRCLLFYSLRRHTGSSMEQRVATRSEALYSIYNFRLWDEFSMTCSCRHLVPWRNAPLCVDARSLEYDLDGQLQLRPNQHSSQLTNSYGGGGGLL